MSKERNYRGNGREKPEIPEDVRRQVMSRARDKRGILCCELTSQPLMRGQRYEMSHINHNPTAANYNRAENIQLVSVRGHYIYHARYIYNPEAIGLRDLEQNYWALSQIWLRLNDFERRQMTAQGLHICDIAPLTQEETEFQRYVRENPAPEFDPGGFEMLDKFTHGSLQAKIEQEEKSLQSYGITIPGL